MSGKNAISGLCTTATLFTVTATQSSFAADTACPSSSDTAFITQKGDTWYSLAGRSYCLDGEGTRSRGALALHGYNRGRTGPDIGAVSEGVKVCIPQFLHGSFFSAERCRSAPLPDANPPENQVDEPAKVTSPPAVCGNGVREEDEFCDGRDLGGTTCATLNLPAGKLVCRIDCRGFDAATCVHAPTNQEPTQALAAPPNKIRPDVAAPAPKVTLGPDVAGGLMFPLAERQRQTFYGVAGFTRLGMRVGVGLIELAVHGFAGGSSGTVQFYPAPSNMSLWFAGAGMQGGWPFGKNTFRFIPGLEAFRVWTERTTQLPDVYERPPESTRGWMSLVGAFVRAEYHPRKLPRFAVALEVASDVIVKERSLFTSTENVQIKVLGGLSYAAF